MASIAVCPSCGAQYDMQGVATNQMLVCRKCGATFSPSGAGGPSAQPYVDSPHDTAASPPTTSPKQPPPGLASWAAQWRQAGWSGEVLFTVGVVILVFAYMLSVIDGAAVARARAARSALELEFRDDNQAMIDQLTALDRDVLKARRAVEEAQDNASADTTIRQNARQALDKAQDARSKKLAEVQHASRLYKLERERDIDRNILSQSIDSDANSYWYAWLQLPGFVCLFVGCIAYLKSDSGVKRVTASIILAISLSVLVMLHLVPGALRSQSLFKIGGARDVTYIEDERDDFPRRPAELRR